MPPKWSSGRACGAASTTQRTRSASLRSHALMDKMEKKKDARKKPSDLQELCTFSAKVHQKRAKVVPKTKPNHRNDAGTVPFEARGVHKLKKQARTPPLCQKGAMASKGGQKGAQKESGFTKNCYFWGSCAQGLILTCFLLNWEAIYARNGFKTGSKI